MKKLSLLVFISVLLQTYAFADVVVFNDNNKFGLKDDSGNVIQQAKYKKLIKLGTNAWIMQDGSHFGIIDNSGKIIVDAKYSQAERVLGKYAKLKKGEKYGIFDEKGFVILPVEYSSIDLLYGGMFVTSKNFKYGVTDLNGQMLLDNIFDDVYMENFTTLVLVYDGKIYKIERKHNQPIDTLQIRSDYEIREAELSPILATEYYGVTVADYILKVVSSISPAYEKTIDELMFSQGADTVSVIVRLSWIPKFPFVYAKKYYSTLIDPNNGPLSSIKTNIKKKD